MFNRAWVITTELSSQHVDEMVALQSANSVTPDLSNDSFEVQAERYKKCNLALKRMLVTAPFSILGKHFLFGTPQDGRHYGKLVDMLTVVTSLAQYARPTIPIAGKEHVFSTLSDLEMTLQLLGNALPLSAAMIDRDPLLIFTSLDPQQCYTLQSLKDHIRRNEYFQFSLAQTESAVVDRHLATLINRRLLVPNGQGYGVNPRLRHTMDGTIFDLADLDQNFARVGLTEGELGSNHPVSSQNLGILEKYGVALKTGNQFIWDGYHETHVDPLTGKTVALRIEQINDTQGRIIREEKDLDRDIEKALT